MNTVSPVRSEALPSILQRLTKGVDTKVLDDLLDELLSRIGEFNEIAGTVDEAGDLCFQSHGEMVAQVHLPRAKSIFRVLLARLSVRCSEWANREISPYGDHIQFELPPNKLPCEVVFQNTTDAQRFEIRSRNGQA